MRRHLERDLQPSAEISHMLLPGNAKSALFRQGTEEIDDFRRFPVDRIHNFASQHAVCVDDVAFGNLNCSVKMLHFGGWIANRQEADVILSYKSVVCGFILIGTDPKDDNPFSL
jgi:hypothetical protein